MVAPIVRSFHRGGIAALAISLLGLLAFADADASALQAQGFSAAPPPPPPPPTATPPAATPPVAAPTTGVPSRLVYPVRGPHQYWDGFGADRGHEGADVGARCGTPLVAAQAGRISFAKYHGAAGNYLVIDVRGSVFDYAYMHLREPALVSAGQSVRPGQLLGHVGDTGNASGCHLHFELWEGAYYGGGAPIDPMPFLTSLESARKKRAT